MNGGYLSEKAADKLLLAAGASGFYENRMNEPFQSKLSERERETA